MHIEFHGDPIVKTGTSAKGPWTMRHQQAYLFLDGKPHPLPFMAQLPDELPNGYQVGQKYQFADSSFAVDDRGNLAFAKYGMAFVPVKTSSSMKAA